MFLKSLQIGCFRNFEFCKFSPGQGVNFIFGENGSGKTSLFEAIYLLGTGRSFRANELKYLIKHGGEGFSLKISLVAALQQEQLLELTQTTTKEYSKRFINEKRCKIAEIAKKMPVQLFNHKDYQLLTDSSSKRRQLIDWGLFHVEHFFYNLWQSYQKLLKQRNAALKLNCSLPTIIAFDREIIPVAIKLSKIRELFLSKLQDYLAVLSGDFFPRKQFVLVFKQGWSKEIEYEKMLKNRLKYDIMQGYTLGGPHRADFVVFCEGRKVQHELSLGQQKIFSILLKIALSQVVYALTKKKIIYLIDDLLAELDEKNKKDILSLIMQLKGQVFLTSVQNNLGNIQGENNKMFHVEQGCIKRLPV